MTTTTLLRQLVDLCLLRGGPQDLPHSLALTRGLIVAGIAVDLIYASLLDMPQPLLRMALSLALLLLIPWLLLGLRERRQRYLQTLAALAGSSLLFTLAFLPLALYAAELPPLVPDTAPEPGHVLFSWITLILLSWKLVINGHIYRNALDWPRLPALLLAFGLFLLELGLDRMLIGTAA
jgi:hypothetical protein